jgi:hypothetical protein
MALTIADWATQNVKHPAPEGEVMSKLMRARRLPGAVLPM